MSRSILESEYDFVYYCYCTTVRGAFRPTIMPIENGVTVLCPLLPQHLQLLLYYVFLWDMHLSIEPHRTRAVCDLANMPH